MDWTFNYEDWETTRQAQIEWIASVLFMVAAGLYGLTVVTYILSNTTEIMDLIVTTVTRVYPWWVVKPLFVKFFIAGSVSVMVGLGLLFSIIDGFTPQNERQESDNE